MTAILLTVVSLSFGVCSARSEATLTLVLDTPEILLGEPLRGRLDLQNFSSEAVRVPRDPFLGVELRFARVEEGSGWRRMAIPFPGDTIFFPSLNTEPFAPGDERTIRFVLFWDSEGRQGPVFNEVGSYRLRASIRRRDETGVVFSVESAEVTVAVRKGTPQETEAFGLLKSASVGRSLVNGVWRDDGIAALESVRRVAPDSRLADQAAFALGDRRGAPAEKAVRWLASVSGRIPSLRVLALLRLVEVASAHPDAREGLDLAAIARELADRAAEAEQIGLGKEAAELAERARKLARGE